MLDSAEMLAATRVASIIDYTLSKPMRWLAGKTHLLAPQGWTVASMARAAAALEKGLEGVVADRSLFLQESFMLHIFDGIAEELEENEPLSAKAAVRCIFIFQPALLVLCILYASTSMWA